MKSVSIKLSHLVEIVSARIRGFRWRMLGAALEPKVRVGPRCRVENSSGVTLGRRVCLEADVWLKLSSSAAELTIGEHTFLARGCTVNVLQKVSIGSHCQFGPNCSVIDHNHGMAPDSRIDEQACNSQPVSIGSDVWCGAGVVILPGVTIGDGAVIGANAVVTRDIPPMAVAAGNPARVIRMRSEAPYAG